MCPKNTFSSSDCPQLAGFVRVPWWIIRKNHHTTKQYHFLDLPVCVTISDECCSTAVTKACYVCWLGYRRNNMFVWCIDLRLKIQRIKLTCIFKIHYWWTWYIPRALTEYQWTKTFISGKKKRGFPSNFFPCECVAWISQTRNSSFLYQTSEKNLTTLKKRSLESIFCYFLFSHFNYVEKFRTLTFTSFFHHQIFMRK